MLGVRCLEISFVVKPGNVMRLPKHMVQSRVDLAGLPSEAW